jgi:hypothetical protein
MIRKERTFLSFFLSFPLDDPPAGVLVDLPGGADKGLLRQNSTFFWKFPDSPSSAKDKPATN